MWVRYHTGNGEVNISAYLTSVPRQASDGGRYLEYWNLTDSTVRYVPVSHPGICESKLNRVQPSVILFITLPYGTADFWPLHLHRPPE